MSVDAQFLAPSYRPRQHFFASSQPRRGVPFPYILKGQTSLAVLEQPPRARRYSITSARDGDGRPWRTRPQERRRGRQRRTRARALRGGRKPEVRWARYSGRIIRPYNCRGSSRHARIPPRRTQPVPLGRNEGDRGLRPLRLEGSATGRGLREFSPVGPNRFRRDGTGALDSLSRRKPDT